MKKKLLSLALALFMVLAFLPASVMAEGTTVTAGEDAKANGQALISAVTSANSGDVITLSAGDYDITITAEENGKQGSGLIINKSITLKAADASDKPVIYGSSDEFNAGVANDKNGQSTIYVSASNVSLENLIIMPLGGLGDNANIWQKTVEVTSGVNGFRMLNCETKPNTKVEGNSMASSAGLVHISSNGAVLEGNSFGVGTKLCAGWAESSDNKVTTYYSYSGTNNTWAGEVSTEGVITLDGKTYVNDEVSFRQAIVDENKTDIVLVDNVKLNSTLNIDSSLTIEGQGKTISGNNDSAYVAFNHTDGTFTMNNVVLKEFGGNTAVGSGKAVVKTDGANAKLYMSNVTIEDFNRAAVDIVSANDFVLDSLNIDCNNSYAGINKLTKGIKVGFDPEGNRAKGTIVNTNIENSASNYEEWSSSGIEIYDGADVTIKGGSISNCEAGIWVDNYWSGSNGFEDYAKDSSVVIEGINIDADDAVMLYSREGQTSKANVKINSGTFNGDIVTVDTTENNSITVGPDAVVRGEISEGVVVIKPEAPSTPLCAGSKDKNCDGVITCDEEKGEGWTWNNKLKVCEYTGKTSYIVVNTAAK